MMSDVCKHCAHAGCLEACPTGALFRTEFGSVVVQQDICNGCGYCVPACPFGVVDLDADDGKAHKCTLCYDRLKGGLEPACAKACPTNSIQFAPLDELHVRAQQRVQDLVEPGRHLGLPVRRRGRERLPGSTGGIGDLHAFFLLTDRPEVYNLPSAPTLPSTARAAGLTWGLLTMAGIRAGHGCPLLGRVAPRWVSPRRPTAAGRVDGSAGPVARMRRCPPTTASGAQAKRVALADRHLLSLSAACRRGPGDRQRRWTSSATAATARLVSAGPLPGADGAP